MILKDITQQQCQISVLNKYFIWISREIEGIIQNVKIAKKMHLSDLNLKAVQLQHFPLIL